MFIDLAQWLDPASTGEAYRAANHIGINHLPLRLCDIEAMTATIRKRGISFLSYEPESIRLVRTILTADPDGMFIQLLEWLWHPRAARLNGFLLRIS